MPYEIDVSQVIQFGNQMSALGNGRVVTLARSRFVKMGDAILKNARGNIKNRTGALARGGTNKTTGQLEQTVEFKAFNKGFNYAVPVEHGRGPVVPVRAKALRFVVGGKVVFAKRVGPARAQKFLERGIQQAQPTIVSEASRLEQDIAKAIEAGG